MAEESVTKETSSSSTNTIPIYFDVPNLSETSELSLHSSYKTFFESMKTIHEKDTLTLSEFKSVYSLDDVNGFPSDGFTWIPSEDASSPPSIKVKEKDQSLGSLEEDTKVEYKNKKRYSIGINDTSQMPIGVFLLEYVDPKEDNASTLYSLGCILPEELTNADEIMKLPREPVDTAMKGSIVSMKMSPEALKQLLEKGNVDNKSLELVHESSEESGGD